MTRKLSGRPCSAGKSNTVVSDHACCLEEVKQKDLWSALPGFGGTSLLYPVLLSEGVRKRGLSLARAVELASTNPSRHYGLFPRKGTIAIGSDADLALCDMEKTQEVTAEGPALGSELHSVQRAFSDGLAGNNNSSQESRFP